MLVPERDAAALAGALDALLRSPERRAALGRTAREEVRRKHTWEGVTQRLEEIYERVSSGTASHPGGT